MPLSASKISAARIAFMESVRPTFVTLCRKTVEATVEKKPFKRDQCMILEIAKASANALGIHGGESVVEIRLVPPLHHGSDAGSSGVGPTQGASGKDYSNPVQDHEEEYLH